MVEVFFKSHIILYLYNFISDFMLMCILSWFIVSKEFPVGSSFELYCGITRNGMTLRLNVCISVQ